MIIYDAEQLQKAFITSFVDRRHSSEEQLRSKLILNGVDDNNAAYNVLGVLLKEYRACERFDFSVAFITSDGLDSFLADFASLPKPGRILTGDYLDFTDPDALEKILRNFPAIQLRALNSSKMAFHEKGYTFYRGGYAVSIIGSANMTSNALRRNKELNVRLVSTDNSLLYINSCRMNLKTFGIVQMLLTAPGLKPIAGAARKLRLKERGSSLDWHLRRGRLSSLM